jgi:hypothetical protein
VRVFWLRVCVDCRQTHSHTLVHSLSVQTDMYFNLRSGPLQPPHKRCFMQAAVAPGRLLQRGVHTRICSSGCLFSGSFLCLLCCSACVHLYSGLSPRPAGVCLLV